MPFFSIHDLSNRVFTRVFTSFGHIDDQVYPFPAHIPEQRNHTRFGSVNSEYFVPSPDYGVFSQIRVPPEQFEHLAIVRESEPLEQLVLFGLP